MDGAPTCLSVAIGSLSRFLPVAEAPAELADEAGNEPDLGDVELH